MNGLIAAREWLTVIRLPPDAPEPNPVEGIASVLKWSLANVAKHDIGQLTVLVKTWLRPRIVVPARPRRQACHGHLAQL